MTESSGKQPWMKRRGKKKAISVFPISSYILTCRLNTWMIKFIFFTVCSLFMTEKVSSCYCGIICLFSHSLLLFVNAVFPTKLSKIQIPMECKWAPLLGRTIWEQLFLFSTEWKPPDGKSPFNPREKPLVPCRRVRVLTDFLIRKNPFTSYHFWVTSFILNI